MPQRKTLNKTERQKKEYDRMRKQLNFFNNWEDRHKHILKKDCKQDNIHFFQLFHHYTTKANRIKKQLDLN